MSARDDLIERAARAYYEWACCGTEGSRWDDQGPFQEGAQRFARERAAMFLDAFMAEPEDVLDLLVQAGLVEEVGHMKAHPLEILPTRPVFAAKDGTP